MLTGGWGSEVTAQKQKLFGSDRKPCCTEVTVVCSCWETGKQDFFVSNSLIKEHEVSHEAYTTYNWLPRKPLKTTCGYLLFQFLELWLGEGENKLPTESHHMCANCPLLQGYPVPSTDSGKAQVETDWEGELHQDDFLDQVKERMWALRVNWVPISALPLLN